MTSGPNPNVHTFNNFSSLANSFFSRLCHWVGDLLILEHTERSLTPWPLRHLIRVMRKHDQQKDKDILREHLHRAIFETGEICDGVFQWKWNPDFVRFSSQNFPPNADMVIGKPGQERFWKGWRGLGGGAELQISDLLQEFHKRSNWT